MATRPATKAGAWYTGSPDALAKELDGFLAAVPDTIDASSLPIPGARVIIAPHAGYRYSGKCAAWAYRCLDLTDVKRVFLLGPSHTYYLDDCAVTTYAKYQTPFGDFKVDADTLQQIKHAGHMKDIPRGKDADEHSLEMHLPYLWKRCQQTFDSPDQFPPVVPILVGDLDVQEEKAVGNILLPFLRDKANAFIVSSDFCHWGQHFRYMVYAAKGDISRLTKLRANDGAPTGPPIHETIRLLDETAMEAVGSGKHDALAENLRVTNNTVCGRHPIGVMMAGLELLAAEGSGESKCRFHVVQYDRSNLVQTPGDYSVSYVSAYAKTM
ncbi:hypothetical protein CDD82_2473 [Ophiocordyceps australis]|uniref:AmmeMemoRadiSam system protein B n=1 Tax=Ophiocordyceps australis TaxID=1399860 RepID=A0A2C5ZTZ2_9HYPO|nr:hypothetical protein CDD82_2473 [Ophiocordyceps australis]